MFVKNLENSADETATDDARRAAVGGNKASDKNPALRERAMSPHMASIQRKKALALEARLNDPNDALRKSILQRHAEQTAAAAAANKAAAEKAAVEKAAAEKAAAKKAAERIRATSYDRDHGDCDFDFD